MRTTRAVSAVGSEHLPYKQRVGGSNPSLPTRAVPHSSGAAFSFMLAPSFYRVSPQQKMTVSRSEVVAKLSLAKKQLNNLNSLI